MKHFSKLSLLLPLALFIAASIQYLGMSPGAQQMNSALYIRDHLIIFMILLSLPLIYKQKWASDRNVLRGLRSLFLLILFTSVLLFLSGDRLYNFHEHILDNEFLDVNLSDQVLMVSWAFFATVFILIALGTLRNLIYIKRKQSTARNFTWLMVVLTLYAVMALPEAHQDSFLAQSDTYRIAHNVVLFLLINLMVINAFRVSWINYLNKKQKLGCFWGGLLLLPIEIAFTIHFHSVNPVFAFSPVLEKFIEMGNVFVAVYLGTAFLALLAHLPTAKLYDRKLQQISSLTYLSRAISSEFDRDKLVRTIVRMAAEVTEADFAWLELRNSTDDHFHLTSSCRLTSFERKTRKIADTDPLLEQLFNTRNIFMTNQASKNSISNHLRRWKKDLGSLLAVPLVTGEKVIGILYAGKKYEFGFEQDDGDMLRAFSDQAVVALENARLVQESLDKERLEQELKIAHEAQMKLLPKTMPVIPGIEIDAVCITANEVGGDYYDFFELSDGKLGIIIGDVSGKGPSAAFYMAEVKGIMESLAQEEFSPKEMLLAANKSLYKNFERNVFISLVYGIIDSREKTFTFCRAGHCPVLLAHPDSDKCERLEPKGLGVGLDSGAIFETVLEQVTLSLQDGHTVLLYTDGVTESRNPAGEEFGENKLLDLMATIHEKDTHEIKKQIIHQVFSFLDGENAYDDLTFIVFRATGDSSQQG